MSEYLDIHLTFEEQLALYDGHRLIVTIPKGHPRDRRPVVIIEPLNQPAGDDIPEYVKEFNHYARLAREGSAVPPGPWDRPKPQPKIPWWRRTRR